MKLKVHGVKMESFHFLDINDVDDDEKKRILNKKDTVDISNRTKKEDTENELIIVPYTCINFTFDERYYFIGELAAKISLFDTSIEEFEKAEFQSLFIEKIINVFTNKFDLFVALFSQEVYSGTRLPERTKMEIIKREE